MTNYIEYMYLILKMQYQIQIWIFYRFSINKTLIKFFIIFIKKKKIIGLYLSGYYSGKDFKNNKRYFF